LTQKRTRKKKKKELTWSSGPRIGIHFNSSIFTGED
jgi:hypothetical protein